MKPKKNHLELIGKCMCTPADHVAPHHLQTYSSPPHHDPDGFCHLNNTVGGYRKHPNLWPVSDWKSKWRQMDGDGDVCFSAKT